MSLNFNLLNNMRKQKAFGQNFSNLEFISSINKYIPSLVLQHMTSRLERNNRKSIKEASSHNQLPELQPMETVCLFADISGFTNLSEKCANMGVRGNEELAFCINRYMEGMVKNLSKYGGDIIKFVGDAMIVMWPPPTDEFQHPTPSQKQDTVKRAIQCALDIQREMGNLVILEGVSGLSVKIGIGYGKCALLYVGGVFNRAEFFTVGEALKYALKSEGCATNGGQIIVAGKAFECVKESYQAKELINDDGEKFYLIGKLVGEGAKTRADAQLLRSQFRPETFTSIQQQLRFWVPAAIIPYLQIGAESFGSETRSLTVMFLNLGIDLSSAETEQGMMKIQKIVTTVQQQIYRLQGSVNKLVMDDKGSTFICLWGVCPLSHEDDAARAILTGFNIINALEKIESTKCKIGISSGEVFSGVVGTAGSRKEFSVLGDVVNLAARIMGSLKYSNKTMCIDLNTRNLAAPFFQFNYIAHKEFKGKSISLAVFEPIDPSLALVGAIEKAKVLPPEAMLFTHSNPLVLDTTQELKKKNKAIGLDNLLFDLVEKLVEFSRNDEGQPFMAVIKGEIGSGKTLFALNLIDEIAASRDLRLLQEKQGKTWIYTSSLNAETELQFLNIWRPVLQMMLINLCKRENWRKEKVIRMLIKAAGDEYKIESKLELICSILGIEKEIASRVPQFIEKTPQIQPKSTPFAFVSRPDYEDRNEIISILLLFFKIAIGETEDLTHLDISQAKSANRSRKLESSQDSQEDSEKPMSIIILDNAHQMDQASWQFFEAIRDECYRVAIILCMQTDDQDKIKVNSDVRPIFESIWFSQAMEDLVQVDLPMVDEKQLHQLILQCAQRYQISYMDEISKMTGIVDPQDTIKTVAMGTEWTQRLVKKWQLQTKFKSVEPDILLLIVKKCSGNPLICLNFFVNMLHNGIIKVDSQGGVHPTNEFTKCNQLSDWKNVPVPRLALKINCSRIDDFLQNVQQNPRKRPGDLELCITSIVILKSAVVLGEEFELRALKKVQPLSHIVSDQMLLVCLKLLEQSEMIEILDETDSKNVLCRFSKNFLRESLYQILLYRECKQQLHTAAAEYLQNSAPSSLKDPEIEAERLKQHMLKAQDIANEAQLSYQSKTGLIVRRIQNLIINYPNSLILSQLIYKEARSNGKLSQRLCSLSSKHLRWYHDESELKTGIFMGSVPLANMISCIPSVNKDQKKFSFSISTSVVIDRNLQKQEYQQNLDFVCNDRESRDQWVISLDFLRTRAVYEDYAQKNIPVKFPLKSEEEKVQEYDSNNINDLLFDFANKLKGKTVVSGVQNQNKLNLTGLPGINGQSFISNKKGYRQSVIIQDDRAPYVSAAELVPKLKCLYNAGMVSFLHHINQKASKVSVRQQQAKLGQLPDRAVFEIARITDQLLGDQPRSSISSNEHVLKFQNSEKNQSSEKKKRRGSSNSLHEMRRPTAAFQKDNLITEEGSDVESSMSENVHIPIQKTKTKNDVNRRSQEVNDLDTSLLQNQEVDISKQIKKVNEKLKQPKNDSKPEKKKTPPEKAQARELPGASQEQALFKRTMTFTPPNAQQVNNQKPHKESILNSVEESSIYKNPASEYQDMTQDLSQFSDLQAKPEGAQRLKTGNFGEEISQIYAKTLQEPPQINKVDMTNTTDHNIIQSIEKLIQQQLGRGFKDIMTQNQQLIENQQRQINQQMQMLNQSLTHNQILMQQATNHAHSPDLYRQNNTHGMGITSRGKNALNSSMLETPQKIQTEEDDMEPEDPESQIMIGPDRESSLNQSEIQRLYQDYPPMLQQLGTSPQRPVQRQQQVTNMRPAPKQDLAVFEAHGSELGTATAKYMQRLYKKQQKLHQEQLAQEKQQKKETFFPLPDHLWDEDLARKPHEHTRYARAVRRCQCQLVGDIMEVPTGAKVRIIERIEDIQMYRIKYDKRVGLFLMRDFKPIPDPAPILMPAPKEKSLASQNLLNLSRDQHNSYTSQRVAKAESIHEPSHQSIRSDTQGQRQELAQPKKNFFKERGKFDFLY